MPDAFVCARRSSKPDDTSESADGSATPCWQKQQMGVTDAKERSNGHLAWPGSHRHDSRGLDANSLDILLALKGEDSRPQLGY
jgi:hypothetical protein